MKMKLRKLSIENKLLLFVLIVVAIALFCASCTPSPYLVVQYVNENEALCRDSKGYELTASIDKGVPTQKGDTLLHVGNFQYYNINSK